jgi:4-amino-4-deoxychorismate lyase
LFFNFERYATETTVANLFIVKNDQVFTPSLASGLLAGVTRERLLHLCKTAGIACIETSIDRVMIAEADAVFITNVLQGIQLIASFDAHHLPVQHAIVSSLRYLLDQDKARL